MIDAKYISDALGGKKSGSGYIARCVSHEDENPSLSIDDGDKGVLVCCRAGCSQDA
jgi:DNA primase